VSTITITCCFHATLRNSSASKLTQIHVVEDTYASLGLEDRLLPTRVR